MPVRIANDETGQTIRRVVQDGEQFDFSIDGAREYTYQGEGEAPEEVVAELEEWVDENHGPLPDDDAESDRPESEIIDVEGDDAKTISDRIEGGSE